MRFSNTWTKRRETATERISAPRYSLTNASAKKVWIGARVIAHDKKEGKKVNDGWRENVK